MDERHNCLDYFRRLFRFARDRWKLILEMVAGSLRTLRVSQKVQHSGNNVFGQQVCDPASAKNRVSKFRGESQIITRSTSIFVFLSLLELAV